MSKMNRFAIPAIVAVVLTALFLFVLAVESSHAISLSWHCYLVAPVLALLLALPGTVLPASRKACLGLVAAFTAGLFSLAVLPISPVKPFRQFYSQIGAGMGAAEVQRLLDKQFPSTGAFNRPQCQEQDGALVYTLDPHDGRYNAEFVVAYLKNGRVTHAGYAGD